MSRSSIDIKRKKSPIAVVLKVEALTKYIFTVTNNEKVFPKKYRFDLVQKLHIVALNLNASVIQAVNMPARYKKESKKRIKKIEQCIEYMQELGALMIITNGIITLNNPEQYAKLFTEASASLKYYYDNSKRFHNRLPSKKEYYHKLFMINLSRKIYKLNNIILTDYYRDSEGFVVLQKKNM